MQNKVEKQEIEFIDRVESKRSPWIEIPIDDPQSALRFCKALACNLTFQSNGVVAAQQDYEKALPEIKPAAQW